MDERMKLINTLACNEIFTITEKKQARRSLIITRETFAELPPYITQIIIYKAGKRLSVNYYRGNKNIYKSVRKAEPIMACKTLEEVVDRLVNTRAIQRKVRARWLHERLVTQSREWARTMPPRTSSRPISNAIAEEYGSDYKTNLGAVRELALRLIENGFEITDDQILKEVMLYISEKEGAK
jgi:hypothetical protein